jgi:flagellar M-ring protein FliF
LQVREIETALNDAGIKNRIVSNATAIEVDERRINNAKIEVETKNILSHDMFTYADALMHSGMATTESQNREMERRAKQTDIAISLMEFDGIERASVHITLPPPHSMFIRDQYIATAGIALQTSRPLSRREGEQIARFVARSVEGLTVENVTITDMELNPLFDGADLAGDALGSLAEQQNAEWRSVTGNVRTMFAPIFDDIQVVANLIYDNDVTTVTERILAPPVDGSNTGVTSIERGTQQRSEGGPGGAEPGLGANDMAPMTYETVNAATGSSQYRDWERFLLYNETVRVTESKPSSYDRDMSSISVNFFNFVVHEQEKLMQADRNFSQSDWDTLVAGAVDRRIVNEDDEVFFASAITRATGIRDVSVSQWEINQFVPYVRMPIPIQNIVMYILLALLVLMLAFGLIRRIKPEEEDDLEPELSVEDLLVSTQMEEAKEISTLQDIDYNKESEVKRLIEKIVTERPDAVAQLLRNWINSEEW